MSGPLLVGLTASGASVAAMLLLSRRLALGPADFEIRLGPGDRVRVTGKVPLSKVPGIRAFFRELPGGFPRGRVRGHFEAGGTPRLRLIGKFRPEAAQRTRNYLIEHLR